jgi:tripartite-type tricarboxylate transporter receptor subunit TctC
METRRRDFIKLLGASTIALPTAALAEDYPARPVTIVSPYAAGGGADLVARLVGAKLGERLGQSFVVENRLGAGGVIAAASVAKSTPDGYTLFLGTSTQLAIQATLHRKLPYDPAADFVPLALVASAPFVLIVHPSLPVHSLADLIALAKERPGQLSFGSSGVGGPPHLYTELLSTMTGIRMTHIPYKGTAQAIHDLVAGEIPIIFCDLAPAVALIKEGKVRALGISSTTRFPTIPEVPPIAEAGVPGFDAVAWLMLVAPAGTPGAIADKLHAETKAIVAASETQRQLIDLGVIPIASPPRAELARYVRSELVRWGKVVEQAGLAGSQ